MTLRMCMTATAAAMLIAAAAVVRAQQAPSAGRTVWDGVYSDGQSKRGAQVYAKSCVNCHGDNLQGDGSASALSGPGFLADFNGASLGEMVDRTRQTMPDDNPGSMSRQQITDVLVYVLHFNKFPAGDADLPTQAEVLNQIKFLASKPGTTDVRTRGELP
jgi:mono/diheme cytochrome c family protein